MLNQLSQLDAQKRELYHRIQAFSLDQPGAQFPFSQRLARDNRWSLEYAQRVIEEYKKFAFLAVVADHPVSPSDQVDQVWHLHLCYTHSYWQEFCPNILQTPLHHQPTNGGPAEQVKFNHLYGKTLESYQQFFGSCPPADIWPQPEDRFGRDLRFIRINTQQNWILSKPNWNTGFKPKLRQAISFPLLVCLSFVVASCQIIPAFPNPIGLPGLEFLIFYILLAVIGVAFAFWLRFSLCSSERSGNVHPDLSGYEVAFLAGGNNRMMIAAIANLVKQGHVEIIKEKSFFIFGKSTSKLRLKTAVDQIDDPIEKVVAQSIETTSGEMQQILPKITATGDAVRSRLQDLGLFLSDQQATKAQLYPSLIVVMLLGLGLFRLLRGFMLDKPVGFLFVCICLLFISGSILFKKPRRSRYGDRIFHDLTARSQALKTSQSSTDIALAVGLFGVTVLTADPALADFHSMVVATTTTGGSGDGGGCGGSGCGGGGCGGGCGGCGGG